MGLANGLTVLRILLIPVFVTLLVDRKPGWALFVFSIAALTDLLDGWVARYQGIESRLGAFLDPMADKMLLMASFVTLTYLKALPFWITAVVITRDAMLLVGALIVHMVGVRIYPRPTWVGKAATFFQILTVLAGLGARWFQLPLSPKPIVWVAAVTVGAQQPQPLVIQGGTLIDGNGGTPVANSVIVIQGNQIAAAGAANQVAAPPGAVMVTQGAPSTTLTITGFNFVARSRVLVDGVSVSWRRVSPTELAVTLDENMLRRAGRFDVVVVNPEPLTAPKWGNGTSNKAHLLVNYRY